MSEEARPQGHAPEAPAQTDGQSQPQSQARDHERDRDRGRDRFGSRLRSALGTTPFVLTKLDQFMNWARGNSMFMLQFGIACCSIEMMHGYATKHDLDRFGAGVPRASPRQADVLIVPGTIVSKFGPRMQRIYDQMPEPKFVVSMGSCTISGGPFHAGYNVINGVEKLIPVDIHVPGCPPRPEALIYGVLKLQERIRSGEAEQVPVTVKPYELEAFGDLERDALVERLTDEIDEDDLVMRYDWVTAE